MGLKFILGFVLYMGIVFMEFSFDYVGLMVKIVYDVVLLFEVGILGNF